MTARARTRSWADSPVNQFRSRVNGKLRPIHDGFGRTSPASSLEYDPTTSSWRTSPASSSQAWERSSVIFPPSGMMRGGVVSPQRPLERPSSDGESSLWPTPTTQDAVRRAYPSQWNRNTDPLHVAVLRIPTPTANDWKGAARNPKTMAGHGLAAFVRDFPTSTNTGVEAVTGQLNPTWVEWLMGFPTGWTDLEPSVTP